MIICTYVMYVYVYIYIYTMDLGNIVIHSIYCPLIHETIINTQVRVQCNAEEDLPKDGVNSWYRGN